MDDWLPWDYAGRLTLGGSSVPSPEEAAEGYARDNWYPDSPEDDAIRRLKDFLCESIGIGCADAVSP